jgi:hypothetical protein
MFVFLKYTALLAAFKLFLGVTSTFAEITEQDMQLEFDVHRGEIELKQRETPMHRAYAFADVLMEKAYNTATTEELRGKYVNMANLALMGYGFGGISKERRANSHEVEAAQRAAKSIGFMTKRPNGIEPTLSDGEEIQRHWYTLNSFMNEGIQERGLLNPALSLGLWTWYVPKTVFRPSMYYRGEGNVCGEPGSFRTLDNPLRQVLIWPYYFSLKDIIKKYGLNFENARLVTYGIVLDKNHLGTFDDIKNYHNLSGASTIHVVNKESGVVRENPDPLQDGEEIFDDNLILRRIPEKDRAWLLGEVGSIINKNFKQPIRDDYKHEYYYYNSVKKLKYLKSQILYLCTFYSRAEQEIFLRMLKDYFGVGHGQIQPDKMDDLIFSSRHLSLPEKEAFFELCAKPEVGGLKAFDLIMLSNIFCKNTEEVSLGLINFLNDNGLFNEEKRQDLRNILDIIKDHLPNGAPNGAPGAISADVFFERLQYVMRQIPAGILLHQKRIIRELMPQINVAQDVDWEAIVREHVRAARDRIRQEEEARQRRLAQERAEQERALAWIRHRHVDRREPIPEAGINVHAGDRDARTLLAVRNLLTIQRGLQERDIEANLTELEGFINTLQEGDIQMKARVALGGGAETGAWGHINGTATLGGIRLKDIYAHFWHFCKTYQTEGGYENPNDIEANPNEAMKIALIKSMADGVGVCPQGKAQRSAIAILQGRLQGVNIDGLDIIDDAERTRMAFETLPMEFTQLMQECQNRDFFTAQEQYRQRINEYIEGKRDVIRVDAEFERYRTAMLEQLEAYMDNSGIPTYAGRDKFLQEFMDEAAAGMEGQALESVRAFANDLDDMDNKKETVVTYLGLDGQAQMILDRILRLKAERGMGADAGAGAAAGAGAGAGATAAAGTPPLSARERLRAMRRGTTPQ